MSSSDNRQARLLEYYEEPQEIEYLDEHLNDEVVPDVEFFLSESVNNKKIKDLMESLKCISYMHRMHLLRQRFLKNTDSKV